MQILPVTSASSQTTATDGSTTSATASRHQAELFASLLGSAQSASSAGSAASASKTAAKAVSEAASASSQPSEQDLMKLPMSREDVAALREELKEQGFSDDEVAELEKRAASESGMTWGEMMSEVRKKATGTSGKSEKKEISNEDTVQMLGLFGKMGFTPAESQQMVDALGRGEARSVWSSLSAKVGQMAADDTTSLTSSEMTALARAMNLSEDGQARLASLMDKAGAVQDAVGKGVSSAMNLLGNELTAQVGKANQALAEFRDAASSVLNDAWKRENGKTNAGLHQDDVAIKAAQAVAMREAKGETSALADAPKAGTGVSSQATDKPIARASVAGGTSPSGGAPVSGEPTGLAALSGQAGPVAAEQAMASGVSRTESVAAKPAEPVAQQPVQADKNAALSLGREGGDTAGQQHAGSNLGGSSDHLAKDGGWGELWNKVRVEGGRTTATSATTATNAVAAMDALRTASPGAQKAGLQDATLAARAARQVESGILRNVAQDAKQLTLILSPEELGTVNVTLTVKDKEVRAVISADKPETAAMLQEQAAKIRQSLESQGLKVAKLDVQTSVPQDAQNAWSGFEQHNQAREQREALERIRSSVRLARQAAATIGESAQASTETMTARAAGLDLFA